MATFTFGGFAACSDDDGQLPGVGSGFGDAGTSGPCTSGTTRSCSITLGEHDGVLSCYHGEQTCVDGAWAACGAGEISHQQGVGFVPRPRGASPQAISDPTSCADNPCDPHCQDYDEQPEGGLQPEGGGNPTFDWPGGTLSGFPGGLVNKGLKEPCADGLDCQFNRYCKNPKTASTCAHSKCQTGVGLNAVCDTCVGDVCAANPGCCSDTYEHTCDHDLCTTGSSLKKNCDSGEADCVDQICAVRPSCCSKSGAWDSSCVSRVSSVCGLSCPLDDPGSWGQSCVDAVGSVCGAECGDPQPSECAHNVCNQGVAMDANCHPCVTDICDYDPWCCINNWDSLCVGHVSSVCKLSCPVNMQSPPPEDGRCVPWLPGQVDEDCDGFQLTAGVPCSESIPVCNRGTEEAPAGLLIVHYPANSKQYPLCAPASHASQGYCFTTQPIPPGECVSVEGLCNGNGYPGGGTPSSADKPLNGNREIIVNPDRANILGDGIDWHRPECGGTRPGACKDNWTLYSGGGECGPPACSEGSTEAQFKDVNLLFVMDKSGSMAGSRWNGTAAAMKGFFADSGSAGFNVGLEFFPLDSGGNRGDGCGSSTCSATPCSNPMVAAAALTSAAAPTDTQEAALINAVNSVSPGGGTPTSAALDGGLDWAIAGITANPNAVYSVVLVTDGEPTSCTTSSFTIASMALDAYIEYGIRTYTVGMVGANISDMNRIANAGGTGAAYVVGDGNVEQDLVKVFVDIAGRSASCEVDIDNATNVDPADAEVILTSGSGTVSNLTQVAGASSCGQGYYYDDPANPTKFTLCANTCNTVRGDTGAKLTYSFGCAKPIGPTTYHEVYEAVCPAATGPQWGFLGWNASTPGDGSAQFRIRTANTEAELSSAMFVDVGTARANPDTQVCMTPADGTDCPVDLFPLLDGAPNAKLPFLELEVVVNPSSTNQPSVVNNWQLAYSCPPDE